MGVSHPKDKGTSTTCKRLGNSKKVAALRSKAVQGQEEEFKHSLL